MSRIYSEAAKVLHKIDKGRQGVRSALYSDDQFSRNVKKLSALVYGVLKRKNEIEHIIKECKILEDFRSSGNDILNFWLLYVLIYEQFYGNLKIQGGGALASFVRKNKDKMFEYISKRFPESLKNHKDNKQDDYIPRYLRVNQSISTVSDVLDAIHKQIEETNLFLKEDFSKYIQIDKDIKNLLVCRPDIAKALSLDRTPSINELIKFGKVVLQDKGSCFSALAAEISPGDIVLDACSAPGSKAIQAIDMLNKNGCLIALDRDNNRIKTLLKRLAEIPYLIGPYIMKKEGIFEVTEIYMVSDSILYSETGCIFLEKDPNVENDSSEVNFLDYNEKPQFFIQVLNRDFLTLENNNDYIQLPWYNFRHNLNKARIILLDPSCSGSGLPQHGEMNKNDIQDRLKSLSEFQTKMLIHSLTSFSSVETVCYSTCSVFKEENHSVVLNALKKCSKMSNFSFSLDKAINNWRNPEFEYRKEFDEEIINKCLSLNPKNHNCRGFFLAKFIRNKKQLS
ncbi:hypothetical protein FG386_001488 [Cryptosporidium ryanae]|uniref:uncharacterized protein n=1 Tax=Cryptosporidium ryanae TaxID=515981 RepID=UPI003519F16D|nr:hypothetical protein FG386_001488 [Cryptosporidium ryanae]